MSTICCTINAAIITADKRSVDATNDCAITEADHATIYCAISTTDSSSYEATQHTANWLSF